MGGLQNLPFEEESHDLYPECDVGHVSPAHKKARLDIHETTAQITSGQTSNSAGDVETPSTSKWFQLNKADKLLPSTIEDTSTDIGDTLDQTKASHTQFAIPKRQGSDIHPAYIESRRKQHATTNRAKIMPRSLLQSPKDDNSSSSSSEVDKYPFTTPLELPGWLQHIKVGQQPSHARDLEIRMQQIKVSISNCLRDRENEQSRNAGFDKIRNDIHACEYFLVDAKIVKRTRILELHGLAQLFMIRKDGFRFPYDIVADARALHHKWCRGDFDPDIMRGLITKKNQGKEGKQGRFSTSLDPNYTNRVSWQFYGTGDLVSGQWWPILLACMRDGCHGSPEAGISRLGKDGACSVLISGSHYDDKDEGDIVYYCGTEGKENRLSDDTKALHDNIRTGKPVRLIRSAKLAPENPLRPSLGFRYDGVYKVVAYEVLDEAKKFHRFKLERESGQDPIRWTGIGARPTVQDKEAYLAHRTLSGM